MQMSKYKTLASNTALISIGTFTSKLLSFFMVRFYTGIMAPSDYGTADLISTTASLLIPLVSLGVSDAVFRFAVNGKKSQQSKVFSLGLYTMTAGIVLFALVSPLLKMLDVLNDYVLLIAVYTVSACYHSLCTQFIRGQGKTALFAGQGVLNTALVIGLNILFLAILHSGITGYILSVVLADVSCTIFLFLKEKLWRNITPHPEKELWKRMLFYSIPLVPTSIFWWITSVSDRYMIAEIIGSNSNGIYAVANKIPTVLALLSGVFMEAWQFSAIKESGEGIKAHIQFYSQIWNLFFSALFIVSSIVIAFSSTEIKLLADEQYFDAWRYIPLLCAAMIFCSFTSFMGSVYMVEKKSRLSFLTSLVGAATNILLNLILIPSQLGIYGAAFSTFASYFIVFLMRTRSAKKLLPFKLYKLRLFMSTAILVAEICFITLQITGWQIVCTASIILLFLVNCKPVAVCAVKTAQMVSQHITRRRS